MTTVRLYRDPCGVARALDVVGDRWALLIVRELLFGPKRFVQLRGDLHGVSANVLSQRLHDLEDTGIVRRDVLDHPASVAVYELTARGRALEPILIELGRWGSQEAVATTNELSVNSLLLALKTVFDPAAGADATLALGIEGHWFALTVAGSSLEITPGRAEHAAVTFESDVATLRSVAFGREPVSRAEREGRLRVRGDRQLAEQFTRMFPVPGQPRR
ncbi:MAG TPA: winged helix-turn-helix transcriptional regulator [Streptosporangiaceae bacterium]|nr:winged helix-turn-helix transcriptional regulator [Streptosporangiaceae bacterium]